MKVLAWLTTPRRPFDASFGTVAHTSRPDHASPPYALDDMRTVWTFVRGAPPAGQAGGHQGFWPCSRLPYCPRGPTWESLHGGQVVGVSLRPAGLIDARSSRTSWVARRITSADNAKISNVFTGCRAAITGDSSRA